MVLFLEIQEAKLTYEVEMHGIMLQVDMKAWMSVSLIRDLLPSALLDVLVFHKILEELYHS